MNTFDQKLHDSIEVERMSVATNQGKYAFLCIFPVSMIMVFGLWDMAPHGLLLIWFTLLTAVNLMRWQVMDYFHARKESLTNKIRQLKRIILFFATASGLCWALAIYWFMEPSQPGNVLIICVSLVVVVVGSMLTWFCYLPAVVALSFPAAVSLTSLLLIQGDNFNIASAFNLLLLTSYGVTSSVKLSDMLNYTLRLNFENAALRQEFEEKSLLLETALENMDQGISMSDQDDNLRMWNHQFVSLLGTAGAQVHNKAKLSALLNAAVPPLKTGSATRSEYVRQNGQVYEIRQSELLQGGRVITYNDISESIKREQALDKARKEAEQANSAKTRFLAAASHDLRQPIHALGLFFAELSDRIVSPDTELVINQVDDSIATINSMLNALLDVSKLDAGVVKSNIESVPLSELFQRLKAEFQAIALENHNQLAIRPTRAIVKSDPAMLERMLRNLIGNALRYTENGRVLVAARSRGSNIVCQVIDTGTGIPEDQLEEIFVEFHQLQNPARDRRQGLGLGLAIVKRQARLLHHDIEVTSRLGQGSCFSITLPKAEQIIADGTNGQIMETQHISNPLDGCCVLVLDDDKSVLGGMRGLLSRWGCKVFTSASQAEALECLSGNSDQIQLLIIDYRLHDNISGIDVAENLQQQLAYPIAVLIITGDTGPERLREADASGYPLLHKPVEPAKLRSTLQYLVNKLDAS